MNNVKLYIPNTQSDSILLSSSRPNLELDPILWLPMTTSERNRVPGGKSKEYISVTHTEVGVVGMLLEVYLPTIVCIFLSQLMTQSRIFSICSQSLNTVILQIVLAGLLNGLFIYTILHELDYYFHN